MTYYSSFKSRSYNHARPAYNTARSFAPRVPLSEQPNVGIYKLEDGTLVKVKENREHTNRYTMRGININGIRLNDLDQVVNFDWEYAPELRKACTEDTHVTQEEAMEWGIKYGRCLCCGRTLKDANSVRKGIGPVCIKYFRF